MMDKAKELTHSEQQAVAQLESIKEMVAALECDRERLGELRDDRDSFEFDIDENAAPDGPGYANDREAWAGENPEDAEELAELEAASKIDGEEADEETARERIQEDALSVQVRSGWHDPGAGSEPEEYEILLCTGGPACRIVGDLDRCEPTSARLEHQDWGTRWQEWVTTGSDHDALVTYARQFYFGE